MNFLNTESFNFENVILINICLNSLPTCTKLFTSRSLANNMASLREECVSFLTVLSN